MREEGFELLCGEMRDAAVFNHGQSRFACLEGFKENKRGTHHLKKTF